MRQKWIIRDGLVRIGVVWNSQLGELVIGGPARWQEKIMELAGEYCKEEVGGHILGERRDEVRGRYLVWVQIDTNKGRTFDYAVPGELTRRLGRILT